MKGVIWFSYHSIQPPSPMYSRKCWPSLRRRICRFDLRPMVARPSCWLKLTTHMHKFNDYCQSRINFNPISIKMRAAFLVGAVLTLRRDWLTSWPSYLFLGLSGFYVFVQFFFIFFWNELNARDSTRRLSRASGRGRGGRWTSFIRLDWIVRLRYARGRNIPVFEQCIQ